MLKKCLMMMALVCLMMTFGNAMATEQFLVASDSIIRTTNGGLIVTHPLTVFKGPASESFTKVVLFNDFYHLGDASNDTAWTVQRFLFSGRKEIHAYFMTEAVYEDLQDELQEFYNFKTDSRHVSWLKYYQTGKMIYKYTSSDISKQTLDILVSGGSIPLRYNPRKLIVIPFILISV